MNHHTATVSTPLRLWADIEAAMRGLGHLFTAPAADHGLEAVEREKTRIVRSSRHWLMG